MPNDSDSLFRLQALSFNTWQVPFVSHYPKERLEAFLESVRSYGKYDIIGLQEIFTPQAQKRVREVMPELGLRYIVSFTSGSELPGRSDGSGCMICSRYPILDSMFLPFAASGRAYRIDQWDWQAGKGVGLARILLPAAYGTADVYVTHLVAQYQEGEADVYAPQRALQAVETSMFVRATRRSDLTLLLGDMNSSPDSLPIRTLLSLGAFKDAYSCTHTPEEELLRGGTITLTRSLSVPNLHAEPHKRKRSRAIVPLRSIFDPTFGLPDNVYARPGGALNNMNQAAAIVLKRLGISNEKIKVEERLLRLDYIFFGTGAYGPSAWPFHGIDYPSTLPKRAWHVMKSDIRLNELFYLPNGAAINISDHSAVYAELGCVFLGAGLPNISTSLRAAQAKNFQQLGYMSPFAAPGSTPMPMPSVVSHRSVSGAPHIPTPTQASASAKSSEQQKGEQRLESLVEPKGSNRSHSGQSNQLLTTEAASGTPASSYEEPKSSPSSRANKLRESKNSKAAKESLQSSQSSLEDIPRLNPHNAGKSQPATEMTLSRQEIRERAPFLTPRTPRTPRQLKAHRRSSEAEHHLSKEEEGKPAVDETLTHWLLLLNSLKKAGVPIGRVAGIYSREGQWLGSKFGGDVGDTSDLLTPHVNASPMQLQSREESKQKMKRVEGFAMTPVLPKEPFAVGTNERKVPGQTQEECAPMPAEALMGSSQVGPEQGIMASPSRDYGSIGEVGMGGEGGVAEGSGSPITSQIMTNVVRALQTVLVTLGVGGSIPSISQYVGSILPSWSPSLYPSVAELYMETARLLSEIPREYLTSLGAFVDEDDDISSCESSDSESTLSDQEADDGYLHTLEGMYLPSEESERDKEVGGVGGLVLDRLPPETTGGSTQYMVETPFSMRKPEGIASHAPLSSLYASKQYPESTFQEERHETQLQGFGEMKKDAITARDAEGSDVRQYQNAGIFSSEGHMSALEHQTLMKPEKGVLHADDVHAAIREALIATNPKDGKYLGHRHRKPPGVLWREILQENIESAQKGLKDAYELRSLQYRMVGFFFILSFVLSICLHLMKPEPYQILIGFFMLGVLLAGSIVGFFIVLFRSLSWKLLLFRLCVLVGVIIPTILYSARKGGVNSVLITLCVLSMMFGAICAIFASIMTVQEIHAFKRGIEQLKLLLSRPPAIIA